MIGLFVFFITIVPLLFILVLILPILKVPVNIVKDYAIIFNHLAIGIGALGFGSFKYAVLLLEKSKLARKKELFRRKYPIKRLNKDYYLIWFHRGKLYLFDKGEKLCHHITPWQTAEDLYFTDLGVKVDFGLDLKSEFEIQVDGDTFKQSDYENGDKIDTTTL